jgi:choline dehydrogenase
MTESHDVVIVGGGPAGCILAARLSEDPARSVLLIEAGPDYGSERAGWPAELLDPDVVWPISHLWGYEYHRPDGGEPLTLFRGRVIGGSGAINSAMWIRASRIDYDTWEQQGNPGWGWDDLLPVFRRMESDPLAASNVTHGSDGPVPVFRFSDADKSAVERAWIESAQELGFPWIDDLNGRPDQQPCVGPTPKNIQANTRMNPALTYLAAARGHPNLTILADTLVDRILFDGTRAVGVQAADGRTFHGSEIILSGGAFCSPAILLRSGIGPTQELARHGIPVVQALPGVGEHLMDHPMSYDSVCKYVIAPEFTPNFYSWEHFFIKARSSQADNDIDVIIIPDHYYDEGLGDWVLGIFTSVYLSRSLGTVRLTSRDPEATLDIDHNYYADPADLEVQCDGVELARRLAETPPVSRMLTPAPDMLAWETRDELRAHLRQGVGTTFHPSSTCRMGPASDPMAVVDNAGRVHGVESLRVVDASIFPHCPRANLHFSVCVVAERIAEMMRAEAPG